MHLVWIVARVRVSRKPLPVDDTRSPSQQPQSNLSTQLAQEYAFKIEADGLALVNSEDLHHQGCVPQIVEDLLIEAGKRLPRKLKMVMWSWPGPLCSAASRVVSLNAAKVIYNKYMLHLCFNAQSPRNLRDLIFGND